VQSNPYQSYVANRRYGGPFDTGGRDGMACDPCNPIYGTLCGQAYDDTFDDAQPIRAAQEAAKSFVQRMRARFDQVAFVEYSDRSLIGSELECVWERPPSVDLDLGVYEDSAWTWCYDNGPGSIIDSIDSMVPLGSTNIAQGIQDGIEVLERTGGHNGRPYALRYIILMTDGVPNRWPGYNGGGSGARGWDHVCNEEDLWPIEGYEEEPGTEEEARARDCAIYYANLARNDDNPITIFTIALGINLDQNLLRAIAGEPPGPDEPDDRYFAVTNEEGLRAAFEEIADRMALRLVE